MLKAKFTIPVAIVGLLATAAPLAAHHAFAAEFDVKQQITLKGAVTKIDWGNPHTYFYVDAKDDNGHVVHWVFQAAGPNTLGRLGWERNSLKVGDQVTVMGYRARGAPNIGSAREVVLPDGHKVLAGAAVDGGPTR